jgi:hypothetical protein
MMVKTLLKSGYIPTKEDDEDIDVFDESLYEDLRWEGYLNQYVVMPRVHHYDLWDFLCPLEEFPFPEPKTYYLDNLEIPPLRDLFELDDDDEICPWLD